MSLPSQPDEKTLAAHHALIRQIARKLGKTGHLEGEDIKLAVGGTQGAVYLVPKLQGVFKLYPSGDEVGHDVRRGISVQNIAHRLGLPVPRILFPLQDSPAGVFYAEEMAAGKMLGIFNNEGVATAQIPSIGAKIGHFIDDFDRSLGHRAAYFGIEDEKATDFAAVRAKIMGLEAPVRTRLGRRLDWALEAAASAPLPEKWLINGDINASNVMVTPTGNITVIDFGVIKKETIEYALCKLSFAGQPLLQAAIEGYEQSSGRQVSKAMIALHAIAHFAKFPPGDKWKDEFKMHRAAMIDNLVANIETLSGAQDNLQGKITMRARPSSLVHN
jgi:hypothetical protein